MARTNTPTYIADEKVATAGTASSLNDGTAQRVRSITVMAKLDNTSNVWIGGSDVATASYGGIVPGEGKESPSENWMDLADTYIMVAVNGEGVDFFAVKA